MARVSQLGYHPLGCRPRLYLEQTMDKKIHSRTRQRHDDLAGGAIDVGRSLDAQTAKRFARSMTRLLESGVRECIIDMSTTQAVDSSGFGSLIAVVRKVGDIGGSVAIVCKDKTVRRLFEVAGITRLVPVVGRMEEARALLAADAAALAS
jgi:anti-anti-sigma factor